MQFENNIRSEGSKIGDMASLAVWPLVASRMIALPSGNKRLRLETEVWGGLDEIARRERCAVADLCSELDTRRAPTTPLLAEIRKFVLQYFREAQ
ncbi:MAG TPA: ribbon-helix-helix domain-containing protein [Azospirillum sp.]